MPAPALLNIVVDPVATFKTQHLRATWAPALLALLVLFLTGNALERSAIHHVEVVQTLAAAGDADASQSPVADAGTPNLRADVTNWLLAFGFILVALAAAALCAALYAMLAGGEVKVSRIWAAIVTIAVPTLGFYVFISGAIALLRGPEAYTTYGDLSNSVPNVSMLVPALGGAFGRGVLEAFNPFACWAAYLYYLMFVQVTRLKAAAAAAGALALVLGGALLQGLVASISS